MNTSGWIRGLMAKNYRNEQFIKHVATCIEQELQQWKPDYHVLLMKLANYELVVKRKEISYWVSISEDEIAYLQAKSPYSLDRRIWEDLKIQGLEIIKGNGNYLEYVFM